MEHAEWNAKVGVPSEFVLLNSFTSRDYTRVDAQRGNVQTQIEQLQTTLERSGPWGTTPLTECLQHLRHRLRSSAPELQQKGAKVMLILVTDGVPNGTRAAFAASIRELASQLPVHVVVRLCTNDDSVNDFYDKVDKEVELSLDILDDFQGEAKNIRQYNPWLTYPKILHTVREAGTCSKLLDSIDERPLTPMEVGVCAQLLIRPRGQSKYPWQPEALIDAVEHDVAGAQPVYDIYRRGMSPIINIDAFRAAVLPGKYSVTGQIASALGLGGVAEAWYEGRSFWDAMRNPKQDPDSDSDSEPEPAPQSLPQMRMPAAAPSAPAPAPQAAAPQGVPPGALRPGSASADQAANFFLAANAPAEGRLVRVPSMGPMPGQAQRPAPMLLPPGAQVPVPSMGPWPQMVAVRL